MLGFAREVMNVASSPLMLHSTIASLNASIRPNQTAITRMIEYHIKEELLCVAGIYRAA
jgi:hypothetical protein